MSSKILASLSFIASQASSQRVDCGFPSMKAEHCIERGCNWDSQGEGEIPRCFFKDTTKTLCPLRFNENPIEKPIYEKNEEFFLFKRFLDNIDFQGTGAVIASQDPNTPGGPYTYHWARDAALTMHTLLQNSPFEEADRLFQKYINFESRAMDNGPSFPDISDVRVEPKFEIPDATAYKGSWCRPQTDGAPLRVRALSQYALELLKRGREEEARKVLASNLYVGALDFTLNRWKDYGCDLWEEVRSSNFFWNKYAFLAGARAAASVFSRLGDLNKVAEIEAGATEVRASFLDTVQGGLLREEKEIRPNDAAALLALVEFYDKKDFNLDGLDDSVKEKFSNTVLSSDDGAYQSQSALGEQYEATSFGLLSPLSELAVATVRGIVNDFCDMYSVNQSDNQDGLPGVLIGRYRFDEYANGNPWVLHTAALASFFYDAAQALLADEGEEFHVIKQHRKSVLAHFAGLLGEEPSSDYLQFAQQLIGAGDGVMIRLRAHNDLSLPEQMDRDSGAKVGAADLTWSFANTIEAIRKREAAVRELMDELSRRVSVEPHFLEESDEDLERASPHDAAMRF